jgi:DNA-binding MarR family transcriptional regulator
VIFLQKKLPVMAKIGVVFLTWRRYLQKGLLPHNITLHQQYILKKLFKKNYLYPSEIAEILFCDRPTASVVIKNMEKQSWIKKEKDQLNGKQIKISITEQGIQKLKELNEVLGLSLSTKDFDPLECFTAEEKDQFDQMLIKLQKHLEEKISRV